MVTYAAISFSVMEISTIISLLWLAMLSAHDFSPIPKSKLIYTRSQQAMPVRLYFVHGMFQLIVT